MIDQFEIEEIGRLFYIVQSRSRTWVKHFVDLEPGNHLWGNHPYFCTCESFKYATRRPCAHVLACAERLIPIIQHLARWKAINQPQKPIEPEAPKRQYRLNHEHNYPVAGTYTRRPRSIQQHERAGSSNSRRS